MKLFTEAQRRELISNGERSAAGEHIDPARSSSSSRLTPAPPGFSLSSTPVSRIGPLAPAISDSGVPSWAM